MSEEERKICIVLLIMISVMLYGYGYYQEVESDVRERVIEGQRKTLDSLGIIVDELRVQSQVNLLLRSYINDSEERKLKKDTAYLNLIETL